MSGAYNAVCCRRTPDDNAITVHTQHKHTQTHVTETHKTHSIHTYTHTHTQRERKRKGGREEGGGNRGWRHSGGTECTVPVAPMSPPCRLCTHPQRNLRQPFSLGAKKGSETPQNRRRNQRHRTHNTRVRGCGWLWGRNGSRDTVSTQNSAAPQRAGAAQGRVRP